MFHFIIGLLFGAIAGGIAHLIAHDMLITLLVGGGVALLYWVLVAVCKAKIDLSCIEFPDFGD